MQHTIKEGTELLTLQHLCRIRLKAIWDLYRPDAVPIRKGHPLQVLKGMRENFQGWGIISDLPRRNLSSVSGFSGIVPKACLPKFRSSPSLAMANEALLGGASSVNGS